MGTHSVAEGGGARDGGAEGGGARDGGAEGGAARDGAAEGGGGGHGRRVFWRYWTGSTISSLGSAVTTVALPLTAVTVVHASTFAVAAITAAGQLPWLVLGLPAGVLVAR